MEILIHKNDLINLVKNTPFISFGLECQGESLLLDLETPLDTFRFEVVEPMSEDDQHAFRNLLESRPKRRH